MWLTMLAVDIETIAARFSRAIGLGQTKVGMLWAPDL